MELANPPGPPFRADDIVDDHMQADTTVPEDRFKEWDSVWRKHISNNYHFNIRELVRLPSQFTKAL
jgi:hypothetical protein